MNPLDLQRLGLGPAIAVFVGAGVIVWFAGKRLSGLADVIAEQTGLGRALMGALFLGGITSLPELVTTVSAAATGNPDMAVGNVLGGVAMQVGILAIADAVCREGVLTSMGRNRVVLLQASFLILVLALIAAGVMATEPTGWPVGLTTAVPFLVVVFALYLLKRWDVVADDTKAFASAIPGGAGSASPGQAGRSGSSLADSPRLRPLLIAAAIAALAILVAGYVLTRAGEVIAEQTGLGSGFVGAALVATSTSLPEISTTVEAVRLRRVDMAFSNIFGANLLDLSLLFVADVVSSGGPILNGAGDFVLVAALLGIVLTAIYVAGLMWGRVRAVGRIGIDSLVVAVVYGLGLYALYTLR